MKNIARFRNFIADFTRLVERAGRDEPAIFKEGGKLLSALVGTPNRIPIIISNTSCTATRSSASPS